MEIKSQWLDSLGKYVFEEGKIITYKWLSRDLNIHVNVAKRLLTTFIGQSKDPLGVCYLIGGVMPDKSHKILVARQENISNIRSLFERITSEHVYSVQKSSTIEDLKVVLYSAVIDAVKQNGIKPGCSAISCKEGVVKSNSDSKRNAAIAQKNKSSEIVSTKKNLSDSKKPTNGSEKENLSNSNVENDASKISNGVKKPELVSPKKTGIAAMFANQKDSKKTDNKTKVSKQPPKTKSKGLASYFGQMNGNKVEKLNKTGDSIDNNAASNSEKSCSSDVNKKNGNESNGCDKSSEMVDVSKENSHVVENTSDIKSKESSKVNKSKESKKPGKKRKKDKDENLQAKKRKRIVMISESESSDEEELERSLSPVPREATPPPPMSEDEEIVPETPQVGRKARKKKLVEKSFLDEDGFLVKHKEYVFASSSEDESAGLPDKNEKDVKTEQTENKIVEPKKKASPQKVKQSSIKNFFCKKAA